MPAYTGVGPATDVSGEPWDWHLRCTASFDRLTPIIRRGDPVDQNQNVSGGSEFDRRLADDREIDRVCDVTFLVCRMM